MRGVMPHFQKEKEARNCMEARKDEMVLQNSYKEGCYILRLLKHT